jgi:steroid delta-isomerase-like uncharacterized protein
MSAQENKALVRRYFEEVWNGGNPERADAFLSPDYTFHPPGPPGALDVAAWKEFFRSFVDAFPDMRFTIEDMVAEEDRVAVRLTFRGTHTGPFQGIPPTDRSVTVGGISIERISEGRIVEGWTHNDALGMLRQMGALPTR